MKLLNLLPLLGGLVSLSCVFEFRPDSPFTGKYEISKGCELDVAEDSATASCKTDGISIKVGFQLHGVKVDKVEITESETNTTCWDELECTRTYTGLFTTKSMEGNPYDGRFSKLHGTWAGTLTMKVTCAKEKAATGAPKYCKVDKSDILYTISATVLDHDAVIKWSADSGASGEFKALETKGGARVADIYYPRIEEDSPSSE